MKLKAISFNELFDHPLFADLCIEYAKESGNDDLGLALPSTALYKALEAAGRCFCIGAFDGFDMVGFAVLMLNDHPHYSKTVGICDAIFVKREHRQGPAGLRLIREVLEVAKEKGVPGVYFTAPANSRLSKLFARLFKETDRTYWVKTKE